ncbi:hypothetical protein [Aliirhizobium smilacinae]|uniref:Uncharacterized protein n=1 Tax=Aliirhizobium smilacinae TaxID=1395944 RepID=A0A5C4X8J0_9HYPH|nr:hypothetical protein [Rhizobium smilacinae]TNM59668.1 hypothetical protein FHP24_28045 [Rhizobium smilacinae]
MLYAIRYFLVWPVSITRKTTDWLPAVFFRKRRLVSGEYAAGCLMMRFVDGKPIYRAMTIEEEQDFREETSI